MQADGSSKNQEQWDATEAQAKQLESLLRAYKLWDDKILFVNDEYETSGEPVKGWGETVASTLAGGASFLAGKIAGFTDRYVPSPGFNGVGAAHRCRLQSGRWLKKLIMQQPPAPARQARGARGRNRRAR